MRIEPATPEDCHGLAELHVIAWQAAYRGLIPEDYLASLSVERREASWRQVMQEGRSELLVARSGEGILGFASFGPSRDADAPARRGELWAIYVRPSSLSTGLGRRLWLAAKERLVQQSYKSVSLWVIVGNERAMRFYRAAGFEVEAGSEKSFEIGGASLQEIRLVHRELQLSPRIE